MASNATRHTVVNGGTAAAYGIVANDSGVDNASAFRTALLDIASGTIDGIILQGGQDYYIDSTILIDFNITTPHAWTTDNGQRARIITTNNDLQVWISSPLAYEYSNATFEHIHFEDQGVNIFTREIGNSASIISLDLKCNNIYLYDCYFTSPQKYIDGFSIFANNTSDVNDITIDSCEFYRMGRMSAEIYCENSGGANNFTNATYDPDIHAIIKNVSFINSSMIESGYVTTAEGTTELGLSIVKYTRDILVENNFFDSNNVSLEINGSDVVVRNNTVRSNFKSDAGFWNLGGTNGQAGGTPEFHQRNYLYENNDFEINQTALFYGTENITFRNSRIVSTHSIGGDQEARNILFENCDIDITGFKSGGWGSANVAMFDFNVSGGMSNIDFLRCNITKRNSQALSTLPSIIDIEKSNIYVENDSWFDASQANSLVDVTEYVNGSFQQEYGNTGASYGTVGYTEPIGYNSNNMEPIGNIVFTDVQKAILQAGFQNLGSTFPDNTTGYSDDFTDLDLRAEQFRSDMSTSGIDRGAFDWFNDGRTLIPRYAGDGTSDTQDPLPAFWTNYGKPNFSNRNIHSAAIKAFATDDVTLATYVFQALINRANDDNLDFSNGGSRRLAGEPTKTNATYGTSERYPFERQETFRAAIGQNPYFMLSSKIEQYLISYSMVFDLVKGTTLYQNNKDLVNYWFNDYYRFIKFSADMHAEYWFGSNWRNFQQDWLRPTSAHSQITAYSDSSGTPLYTSWIGAGQGITNRSADGVGYIHFFGEVFDVEEARDFGYDWFRAMMITCVWADGTFHEHYRWDANPDYIYTQIMKYFFMAHTNEVAVEKGYLPLTDKDKFYGYSTSLGSYDLLSGASGHDNTAGGNKNLELILTNLSRYYRTAADGGYEGVRYRENGTAYSTSHVQNLPQAIFLSRYPNNTEIRDFKNYESSAGYTSGLNPSMQANGQGPHSLGTAWGFGNAIGGHTAFGETNAFSGLVKILTDNSIPYLINL